MRLSRCSRYVFDVVERGCEYAAAAVAAVCVGWSPKRELYVLFLCPHICFTTLKQTFMIRLNDVSGTSQKIMFIIQYYFAQGVSTSKTRKKNKHKKRKGFFFSVVVCSPACVIKRCLFFRHQKGTGQYYF